MGYSNELGPELDGPYEDWAEFEHSFGPTKNFQFGNGNRERGQVDRIIARKPWNYFKTLGKSVMRSPIIRLSIDDLEVDSPEQFAPEVFERGREQIRNIIENATADEAYVEAA